MSRDKSYLFDIYTACELILEFISGVTFQQFKMDIMRQDAIIRRIEIIGEASNNLSSEFKKKYPDIPGLRFVGCGTVWCTIMLRLI